LSLHLFKSLILSDFLSPDSWGISGSFIPPSLLTFLLFFPSLAPFLLFSSFRKHFPRPYVLLNSFLEPDGLLIKKEQVPPKGLYLSYPSFFPPPEFLVGLLSIPKVFRKPFFCFLLVRFAHHYCVVQPPVWWCRMF